MQPQIACLRGICRIFQIKGVHLLCSHAVCLQRRDLMKTPTAPKPN